MRRHQSRERVVVVLVTALVSNILGWGQINGEPDISAPIKQIVAAADKLMASSDDLTQAAGRMADPPSCTMDRELIGLGSALDSASVALRPIEPMLLPQRNSVSALWQALRGNSQGEQSLNDTLAEQQSYREALNDIAAAARLLANLDPLGSAGPSGDAVHLLTRAGQSLADQNVEIGLHVRRIGETMDTIRIAAARYDKPMCPDAARLMGQMVALAGENLFVYSAVLEQVNALHLIGLRLYEMSGSAAPLSSEFLAAALKTYEEGLNQEAEYLEKSAVIVLAIKLPPAAARVTGAIQEMGANYKERAVSLRSTAGRVEEAHQALNGGLKEQPAGPLGARLRSVGEKLGEVPDLIETGKALVRVGALLDVNQLQAAAVLREAGLKLLAPRVPILVQQ